MDSCLAGLAVFWPARSLAGPPDKLTPFPNGLLKLQATLSDQPIIPMSGLRSQPNDTYVRFVRLISSARTRIILRNGETQCRTSLLLRSIQRLTSSLMSRASSRPESSAVRHRSETPAAEASMQRG